MLIGFPVINGLHDPSPVLTSDMLSQARARRILRTLKELSTVHTTNTKLPRLHIQILAQHEAIAIACSYSNSEPKFTPITKYHRSEIR